MIIDIPGDLPTSITKALDALSGLAVVVDDGTETAYVIKSAAERDDHGVSLIGHPWRDGEDGPDRSETAILLMDNVEKITVL